MKKLLLLAGLAAIAFLAAMIVRYRTVGNLDHQSNVTQKREVTRWSHGAYIPTTNSEALRESLLHRIQTCDSNLLLDAPLKDKLTASILALCRAYSEADFDAFIDFRLASPDENTFTIKAGKLEELKKGLPAADIVEAAVRAGRSSRTGRPVLGDGPLHTLEAWWYSAAPKIQAQAGNADPFYCLNCWRQLSPQRFQVFVERRRVRPGPMLQVANRLAAVSSVLEVKSILTARPTVDELLDGGQSVLFAHCLVPVKMNREIAARPLLVSFYWAPEPQKFLPHRLGILGGDLSVYYVF